MAAGQDPYGGRAPCRARGLGAYPQPRRWVLAPSRCAAVVAGLLTLGGCSDPANRPLDLRQGALVGAVLSLTSNANAYGQDQQIGLRLAERWFNGGSVGSGAGHRGVGSSGAASGQPPRLPLRLRLEDGGGDEQGASSAFNLLINEGVLALIGPTLSQQAFAADPIAQRRRVPVLAPSNTAVGIPQIGAFISRVSAPSTTIAPLSIAKALARQPSIRRAAVFYAHDDAYSTSETVIFQKALLARGLRPITVQRTQLADQDFQNPITAALRLNPDLVVISAQAVDGGNLVRQLRELGYRGTIVVGNGMNTPNIYPICQRFCDGVLIAQAYSPELDTPANRAFLRLYHQAKGGAIPPQLTAQAYTAYQVVFEALQRLAARQGLEGLTLRQARRVLLQELLAGRYDTPLGPISFQPDGEVKQEAFFVAQVRMAADGRSGRFALLP